MGRFCVVNVNARDMSQLIVSDHDTLENARWAEGSMTGYSLETEVVEYAPEAMSKIMHQMYLLEEMRENLRTGIRRMARASAASREETCSCSSDNQPGDDCGSCRA